MPSCRCYDIYFYYILTIFLLWNADGIQDVMPNCDVHDDATDGPRSDENEIPLV